MTAQLHSQVLDVLGTGITSGRIAEGEILDLARVETDLDVSRSVVREALRVLGSLGLITARHKVGTRVLPRSRWNLLDPQVIRWRSQTGPDGNVQLRDLLQVRLAIEPLAARLCAGQLDMSQLDTLQTLCDDLDAAAKDRDRAAFLHADELFHATLLHGSGNEILARFDGVVGAALQARQHESRPVVTEQTPPSLRLHRRLVQALHTAESAGVDAAGRRAERVARELVELASVELGLQPEQSAGVAESARPVAKRSPRPR